MAEPNLTLYYEVLHALERFGIDYVIIGTFAGTSYGITRTTYDIDIVVDLPEYKIEALATVFPSPRYYADVMQMSCRCENRFNWE